MPTTRPAPSRRHAGPSLLAVAGLVLAACAPVAPAPPAPPPAVVPAFVPPDPVCDRGDLAAQAVAKLNAYRQAGARCGSAGYRASSRPVRWSEPLAELARLHSRDLVRMQRLDHVGSDGRDAGQRLLGAGYVANWLAENLAEGSASMDATLSLWVQSAGHCANMLAPEAAEIGLACSVAPDGRRAWTLLLARPR